MRKFDKEVNALRNEMVHEIIVEARKIMAKRPHLVEFIIAMGTAFFVDKHGNDISLTESYMTGNYEYRIRDSRSYFKNLNNFLLSHDEGFKLTGEGIRFKLTGKIVTDW